MFRFRHLLVGAAGHVACHSSEEPYDSSVCPSAACCLAAAALLLSATAVFAQDSGTRAGPDSGSSRLRPALPAADRPQPHQSADDDVDRAASELLPADAPVRVAICGAATSASRRPTSSRSTRAPSSASSIGSGSPATSRRACTVRCSARRFRRSGDGMRCGRETRSPCRVSLTGSFEGLNNLREKHQPGDRHHRRRARSATGSRCTRRRRSSAGTHAVDFIAGHEGHDHDTRPREDEHANHHDTWFCGLGGRAALLRTGYITGEYTPRLPGYDPNARSGASRSKSAPVDTPCS